MIIFIILLVLNICFWGVYIIQKIREKRLENQYWELLSKQYELYNKIKKKMV